MSNQKLLNEVKDAACSCDPMSGWVCVFCTETLPKLRRALTQGRVSEPVKSRKKNTNDFGETRSPYQPLGWPALRRS